MLIGERSCLSYSVLGPEELVWGVHGPFHLVMLIPNMHQPSSFVLCFIPNRSLALLAEHCLCFGSDSLFGLWEQRKCMVTDIRETMTIWKLRAYILDFFFTVLWSVVISSSGRPFKAPLVDRPEVAWSTDQRPSERRWTTLNENWTKIEWKGRF